MIYFIFSILSALFLNSLLAPNIGLVKITTSAFLPLMLLIGWQTIKGDVSFIKSKFKSELQMIFLSVIIIIIKYFLDQDYFKIVLNFLILPMIFSIFFEQIDYKKRIYLKKILILFYIIECSLAIYEWFTKKHFFKIINNEDFNIYQSLDNSWGFRSVSLLGHPLANAMAVTTIMSFIILSDYKFLKKLGLVSLGYISLFCFNARGAILIASLLMLPVFYNQVKNTFNKSQRFNLFVFFVLIISISIYYISNSDLGGRLFHSKMLFDNSAKTRLGVFQFYKYINIEPLIFGNNENYGFIMKKLGTAGVENGVITILLSFGIIFTPLILILLFKFQLKKLKFAYPKYKVFFILTVFYVLGTMNPNLSQPIQWTIFVFSFYAFKPILILKKPNSIHFQKELNY